MVNIDKKMNIKIDEALVDIISNCLNERIAQGLTQKQLAEKLNMKQSAIARLENMNVMPNLETVVAVLTALDCKLAITKAKKISVLSQSNCYDYDIKPSNAFYEFDNQLNIQKVQRCL